MILILFTRSEQEKELEEEAVPEATGASTCDDAVPDGLLFSGALLLLCSFLLLTNMLTFYIYCESTDAIVLLAPMEIDEYDLVDPVDILTPLEKCGFWDGVVCDLSCIHTVIVKGYYGYITF
jgi:cytoskeleton-associated protein 5